MSIIDSLVVELSLDPTKFNEGQKKAVDDTKKFVEGLEKHGKDAEKSLKGVEDGFGKVVKLIGQMTAGYLSVSGISNFVQQTNAVNTAVGQQATVLGVAAEKLAQYRQAAKFAGVDANSMVSGLETLNRRSGAIASGDASIYTPWAMLGANPNVLRSGDPMAMLREANRAARAQISAGRPLNEVNSRLEAIGLNHDLIYMIDRTDNAVEKFIEKSKELNNLTKDQIDHSKDLTAAWARFMDPLSKIGNAITDDLAKPLIKVLDVMAKLIKEFDGLKAILEVIGGVLAGSGVGAFLGGLAGLLVAGPAGILPGAAIGARIGAGVGLGVGVGVANSGATPTKGPMNDWGEVTSSNTGSGERTTGGSSGEPTSENLIRDRARFKAELERNPQLKHEFFKHAAGEDSPGSPERNRANQAIMETAVNRASIRGASLAAQLSYFQGYKNYTPAQAAIMEENLRKVLDEGSDISKGAIDNSSSWLAAKHRRTGGFKETIPPIAGEAFQIPGTQESGRGDREKHRSWYERMTNGAAPEGSDMSAKAVKPVESWGQWLGRQMPGWLGGPTAPPVHNKQSSLSIGNMNFHGVRDMNDVAENITPFIQNRYTATQADNGYG